MSRLKQEQKKAKLCLQLLLPKAEGLCQKDPTDGIQSQALSSIDWVREIGAKKYFCQCPTYVSSMQGLCEAILNRTNLGRYSTSLF